MANLISQADGNLTAAATWASVDSTALISTSTASTLLSTSNQNSAAFTPGAITINAIALKLDYVATGTADHTITMTLRNNTDSVDVVSLTYNVNNFRQTGNMAMSAGWMIFKLDTTYALTAGKAYIIQLKVSATASKANVYFCTNGTAANWQHMLRLDSTTNTPAAGDDMFILGEVAAPNTWTSRSVTMNETATTVYGAGANANLGTPSLAIGDHATLTWGTAESTNYYLKLRGNINICVGGTMNMGTTGTPCPRTSTMTLYLENYAASKNYSIYVGAPVTAQAAAGTGTLNCQGQSRTSGKAVWKSLLTSDLSVGATTVNVTDDTGWKSGDVVDISGPTFNKNEVVTLNADAGASSFTLGSGTSYAHIGTEPFVAIAHLLTRNVTIKGNGGFSLGQIYAYGDVDADWAEFSYMPIANVAGYSKTMSFEYCSFWGGYSTSQQVNIPSTADYFYIRHCNFAAGYAGLNITTPGSNWEVTDLVFTSHGSNSSGIPLSVTGYNSSSGISDIYIANFSASSVTLSCNTATGMNSKTFSRWRTYGLSSSTLLNASHSAGIRDVTLEDFITIDSTYGVRITGTSGGFFSNLTLKNFTVNAATLISFETANYDTIIDNFIGGTHTYGSTCTRAVLISASASLDVTAKFINCELGKSGGSWSGITGYTFSLNNTGSTFRAFVDFRTYNTIMNGTSGEITGEVNLWPYSFISHQRKGNLDDTHERNYFNIGKISYQTAVYHTTAPSEKLEPTSSTYKLKSSVRHVPVTDGAAAKTLHVYMRKNSGYVGADPRIMLKRADNLGVTTDTVVATSSLAVADTWYDVSGALPVATDDGVYEVYVDCDGTAGILYLDDWSVV